MEVANIEEMYAAVDEHRIAAFFGVEGGHMIEDDLQKLDSLYKRGARYMTLTHNNSTSWATSASDETASEDGAINSEGNKGLTAFGREVVGRMNHLGMVVDISHVGEQTFRDVMETSSKPVIASHSSVYNLCPVPRNLKDEQIKAVAKNGGVVQINFYSGFIDPDYEKDREVFMEAHAAENDSLMQRGMDIYLAEYTLFDKYRSEVEAFRPPFYMVIDHIEYIIDLVGADYVGLGSDFDGIPSAPVGLDDVTDYPLITEALIQRGYSVEDIHKILGGNILRVLEANKMDK
jgi:membrane dipeptidase